MVSQNMTIFAVQTILEEKNEYWQYDTFCMYPALVGGIVLVAAHKGCPHRLHGNFYHRGVRDYRVCPSLQEVCEKKRLNHDDKTIYTTTLPIAGHHRLACRLEEAGP